MRYLSKLLSAYKSASQKGFTLIELLVVIGILGVLAAALVATIDPFEQLKKANDANIKNTAVEFINANIRYYTTHSTMPWNNGCNANTYPTAASLYPNLSSCMQSLILDGELKTAFTTVTGVLTSILVTGDSQSVTACFQPASRAQRNDQNTRWVNTGNVTQTGCPNATLSTCYWCSQ